MHFDAKRKRNIAIILGFTLALSVVCNFVSERASEKGAEYIANHLGVGSTLDGLTVGAISEINDCDIAFMEEEFSSVTAGSHLIIQTEYEEGTIYGYHNLGFANIESGNLNVRKKPTKNSSVAGKLTRYNAVDIISTSEDGEWYEIKSGNLEGYVSAEYILTGEAALALVDQEIKTYATVKTQTLRVRKEPNTDSKIISKVNDSEDLIVLDILDGWIKVELDDDAVGYVSADYVEVGNKFSTGKTIKELNFGNAYSDLRVSLVQYALQFVGNRYVYGGTSLTRGIDCSGFTMKVYQHFGVKLPHSSAAQPRYGRKIKASEARPGDLFFYSSRGLRIGHVGIYIGGGKIVHAAGASYGIKISSAFYKDPVCVVSYLP